MRRGHTAKVWVKKPREGEKILGNKLRNYGGKLVQVFKVLRPRTGCMVAQGGK
jgi:hypothetical protein